MSRLPLASSFNDLEEESVWRDITQGLYIGAIRAFSPGASCPTDCYQDGLVLVVSVPLTEMHLEYHVLRGDIHQNHLSRTPVVFLHSLSISYLITQSRDLLKILDILIANFQESELLGRNTCCRAFFN